MSIASRLTATVRRPISDSIVDAAIAGYALWTVCCHAVMLLAGNVYVLTWVTGGVAAAGLLLSAVLAWRAWRTPKPASAPEPGVEAAPAAPAPAPAPSARSSLILFALAAIVIVWFLRWQQPLVLWGSAVAFALIACSMALRDDPATVPGAPQRWQELIVLALGVLCGFLALWAHRWRNDDCYYINLAVAMVDEPHRALLSINTIHAPMADSPRSADVFAAYRVHTFEALGGLISHVTKIPAISVIHLGLGGASSALIPLALARLFRLIDPQRWFFMVIAAMCLLLFEGTSGLGFANQGIVRMFTGKSVLLSVGVPMLVHHGIAFGLAPSRRGFLALLGAQIACVGLSSTGLWLAPLAGTLAVCVPLRWRLSSLRTLGLGLLSCAYVIAIALWVRAQLMHSLGAAETGGAAAAVAVHVAPWRPRVGLVHYWLRKIFDEPHVIKVSLGLLLLAVPCARTALARRYMALFGLVLLLLFLDPFIADFMRHNVLGRFTGQRGIWLAPLPAAMAIVFTSALPSSRSRLRWALGLVAMTGGLWLFCTRVPTRHVLTPENGVELRWPPGPRVPVAAFELGLRLTREVPRSMQVLAPEVVSWYLPTIHNHAYPVLANAKYLRAPRADENKREKLIKYVTKYQKDFDERSQRRLRNGLERYSVGAVVVTRSAVRTPGLRDVLRAAGFRRQDARVPGYYLFTRSALSPIPAEG